MKMNGDSSIEPRMDIIYAIQRVNGGYINIKKGDYLEGKEPSTSISTLNLYQKPPFPNINTPQFTSQIILNLPPIFPQFTPIFIVSSIVPIDTNH
jgi:hypothetical protein